MGVYDIASNTWTTMPIPAPIFAAEGGTGNITAVGNLLYMVVDNVFVSLNPQTGVVTNLADAPQMPPCNGGYQRWGALVPNQGKIYGHQGNNCTGMAVYDIASNSWTTLSSTPDGAALGAAIDPVSRTYYAYGPYGGNSSYSYDIGSDSWSAQTSPFTDQGDGGMAYVGTPGLEGVYAVEGEDGTAFTRFVTAAGSADLSLTKTASVSSTTVGDQFSYTLKASNAGPNDSMSTTVTDTLPSGVTLVSATPSSGTCSGTTTVTCNVGAVFAGDSATVTLTVKAAAPGTATNTASVSSSEPDSSPANNSASVSVTISPAADLALTKTASVGSASLGSDFTYTLKVTNAGPDSATGTTGQRSAAVAGEAGVVHRLERQLLGNHDGHLQSGYVGQRRLRHGHDQGDGGHGRERGQHGQRLELDDRSELGQQLGHRHGHDRRGQEVEAVCVAGQCGGGYA
jgi:uncharacterized repeat protein (TIGR01451 family)